MASSNFVVIQQAVRLLAPDLAVIDAGVACWETASLIDRLASVSRGLRILALVPEERIKEQDENGELTAGCLTLLPASASEELFEETLLRILADKPAGLIADAASPVTPDGNSQDTLTPRQRDILRLICSAESTKGIAKTLDISTRTVEFHKYRMMKALEVNTIAELILYGITSDFGARRALPQSLARPMSA